MTLPELAVKRPVTTLMIIVSLVVLGAVAIFRLPLAFMPDVERPYMFVSVPYENASPEQVERMIVRPLEDALGSVKGLKSMWSRCGQDGGRVRLEFDWGQDMHVVRTEIWERVDRARPDLPDDIGDITVSPSWGGRDAEMPIIEGRLSSRRDLSESYDLLERKIVKPLERVPGVAQVRLDGVNPREVRVNLRVEDLERHSVDVRTVAERVRAANLDLSLGKIREGDRTFTVRTVGAFTDVDEVRQLPLRADGLKLGHVADVVYEEPPLEYGRHLDGNFAIGVTVAQESGANTVQVCRAVEERIEGMSGDPELEGVNFLVWFSQGREIEKTMRDLMFTGVFGTLLALVVLYLFLKRISTTVVAVACIPFSLVVTCGVIWALGRSLNTLTLLGLIVGIGMLVDNAVVVMENIFRHREQGADRKTAAREGAREVSVAVVAATFTSVIVFLPLIFFNKPTEMNIYLKELGLTVCLTLLASLFISQTLIPLATARFVRARASSRGRAMEWLERHYVRLLSFNLRRRWLTPTIGLLAIVSAVFPFRQIDLNFDTSQPELFVQVRYRFSEDLSLERKQTVVSQVEQVLDRHREELLARAVYSFWSDRFSFTRIYLEEGEADDENIGRVRSRLRELVPQVAGVQIEVEEQSGGWRHGGGKRVHFQLYGDDSGTLARLAAAAVQRVQTIEGLEDVSARHDDPAMELHVELDADLASRYGLTPDQVARTVGLTYRGRRLPRFRTAQGEREMRLTLDERREESVEQLANLPLWTGSGEKVPLGSVATFRAQEGSQEIMRDDRMTSLWVGSRYSEGTRDVYMAQVAAVLDDMEFPFGYGWTFGQWQQQQKEKSREFLVNLLLALLLVFAVMAGLFESVRQALALMVALPFALAGAVWTLYFTGTDFDQPAAIGLLLLIGIVVNNGIVMIEHINNYRRAGMPREAAMLLGGRERLRPILMTAATTLIGLVPIVVQKPSLGGVYYYSMALVVMGGLAVSTFLTSVLLPTTVTLSEDIWDRLARTARGRSGRRRPAGGAVDLAERG
ncbi:MAG: efflux RND transporter permease subunit [Candidatus Krumholzibacteriia bacterium]